MIKIDHEDGIAVLRLEFPPLNILTRAALHELCDALEATSGRPGTRVLLIEAAGRHFSAGASIEEHMPGMFRSMLEDFETTMFALHEFPLPVIAAVQGRCLGGAFELVQAADLIVAADDAQFSQPEIRLGVIAPVACALLPQRIGNARAAELLFTGDPLDAHAAVRAGLACRTVPAAQLHDEAMALAARMARHSAAALRMTKAAMRIGHASIRPSITAAVRIYTEQLMVTHDAIEGLHAFVEKRPPQWSHQ